MQVSIFVLYSVDGWSTLINGRRGVRHRFQVDAVEEALRMAQAMRRRGREALINVQNRFGEFRPMDEPYSPSVHLGAPGR